MPPKTRRFCAREESHRRNRPPSKPAWVRGDRDRLRQMLLNLVDNASKYNKPGGSITIAARATPTAVTFEIANTGNGISVGDLPKCLQEIFTVALPTARATLAALAWV